MIHYIFNLSLVKKQTNIDDTRNMITINKKKSLER